MLNFTNFTKPGWYIAEPVSVIKKWDICCNCISVKLGDTLKVEKHYFETKNILGESVLKE